MHVIFFPPRLVHRRTTQSTWRSDPPLLTFDLSHFHRGDGATILSSFPTVPLILPAAPLDLFLPALCDIIDFPEFLQCGNPRGVKSTLAASTAEEEEEAEEKKKTPVFCLLCIFHFSNWTLCDVTRGADTASSPCFGLIPNMWQVQQEYQQEAVNGGLTIMNIKMSRMWKSALLKTQRTNKPTGALWQKPSESPSRGRGLEVQGLTSAS